MKRIICFIMSAILVLCFIVPSVCASQSETVDNGDMFIDAVSFSCRYDVTERRVVVDGTVSHDFMISHGDYKIKLYAVLPGHNYEEHIKDPASKPLAESNMTVRFTFYVNTADVMEMYSEYAIVLTSPSGDNYLAAQPMLPSISSGFEYDSDNRSSFKGILTENPVNIGSSGAGTVIVDLDISKTVGDSADSILYQMNDSYIHIRKSYISEIDRRIQAASLKNARVYIRLLLSADDAEFAASYSENDDMYSLPNLYSQSVLEYVSTLCKFISERYDGENGKICGMIPGIQIDNVRTVNSVGYQNVYEYAKLYTMYLVVVGNATRAINDAFDIVIPFSDRNDYGRAAQNDGTIIPSRLLEEIIYRLDNNVSGNFECSIMIESDCIPIKAVKSKGNIGYEICKDNNILTPDTLSVLSSYLYALSQRYTSVPSNIIYLWTPDEALHGNALVGAYVYSYLRLVPDTYVSSLVLGVSNDQYNGLKTVVRYINTAGADDKITPSALYFGAASWSEILDAKFYLPNNLTVIETELLKDEPSGIIGDFQYMDFTASSVYSIMAAGYGCSSIHTAYNSRGDRILRLAATDLDDGEYMEAVGRFEYPESYQYTKYLSVSLEIDDKSALSDALYEVNLTFGTQNTEITATGVITGGKPQKLYLKIDDFTATSLAEYIKLSVRCLSEDDGEFTVFLEELRGYSTEYTSDELDELISSKRMEIRNENTDVGDEFDYTLLMTIVGIVFAMAALAVGLMIVFRHDDESEDPSKQK